jgi:hypothetical protein
MNNEASGEGGDMLRMKKVLSLTILFLAGFVVGVITMEILSRPAQRVRAYRETLHAYKKILQDNFVTNQSQLGYKVFKEGNDLKAMVHLWTVLEAGPRGSELFKDPVSKAFDEDIDKASTERFFVVTLPKINNFFKNAVHWVPGREEATRNGELAVVLEQLGYKEAAKEHYLIASRLLSIPEDPKDKINLSEDKTREFFRCAMKNRKAQE